MKRLGISLKNNAKKQESKIKLDNSLNKHNSGVPEFFIQKKRKFHIFE